MAACAAREAGAVAGGGVTLAAGAARLPGAVGGASLTLGACTALAGVVGGGGVISVVGTTGLPGAIGGTTAVCTTGAAGAGGGVTTVACFVLAGAARRGAAAGIAGSPDAGGCGGATLGASAALAGSVDGGGITLVAGTARLPGAVGGAGVTLVASTGAPDDGSVGGVDGSGTFWRRFGVSAGFSTGGATLPLASGFARFNVSMRRRFGWAAAARCAFAFPGLGFGFFSFCVSSVGNDFPRRGTPRGSSQIHFAAPLPPWVRMRSLFSKRTNSSITHRGDKPASLASCAILIWRQARLGFTMLGDGINSVNTPYNLASASGIRRNSHSIGIFGAAGRSQIICSGLGVELASAAPTCWPA
jgi:hypothetical protein